MATQMYGNGTGSTALVRLQRSLELVGQLFQVSDAARAVTPDDGCRKVFDTVVTSAERMQACAVAEMMAHQHEPPEMDLRVQPAGGLGLAGGFEG